MKYDPNDALDAKIRAAVVELAEAAPNAPTAKQLGLGDGLAMYAPPAPEKTPLRTRLLRGLAGLGLVAGGAGLAVVAANSGDDRSTPEAAFTSFAEAMSDEDAIGLLEAIDPNERNALRPAIEEVLVELNRLGLLDEVRLDADPLSAFDFDVADLSVNSVRVDDGLAEVRIVDGRITSQTEPGTIPLGLAAELYSDPGVDVDMANLATDFDDFMNTFDEVAADNDVAFFMIERDGEWYLNIGYTLLDALVKEAEWGAPDFGNGLEPVGAESPEALLEAWMTVAPYDWQSRIVLIDPEKMPALYDFGPLLVLPDDDFDPNDYQLTLEGLQTELSGDRVRAAEFVLQFNFASDTESGPEEGMMRVSYDGTCVTTNMGAPEDETSTDESCSDDPALSSAEQAYLQTLGQSLTVVERDGLWFVDPIATLGDDLVSSAQRFDVLDKQGSEMFANMVFSDSIFGDIFGFRGFGGFLLRGSSPGFAGSPDLIETGPPGFECLNPVYEAVYGDGENSEPNLNPPPNLRADFEACLAAVVEPSDGDFAIPTYDQVVAEARCSRVFQELYGEDGAGEPTAAAIQAADDEYEACIGDADPLSDN